jgi:hypothetical protein
MCYRRVLIPLIAMCALLAGCRSADSPPPTAVIGEGMITWTRMPDYVVFRTEVIGGVSAFAALGDVPGCTLYGDNRLVWVDDTTRDAIILEDRISDSAIRDFIARMTVDERLYTYQERQPTLVAAGDPVPVVQRITIAVNDLPHYADDLSGWDVRLFDRVQTACRALGTSPVLVAPQAGWLRTQPAEYDMQYPLVLWDSTRTGIRLVDYIDAPGWVSGEGAVEMWRHMRALGSGALYQDGEQVFRAVMQVPGVTAGSPPPPAQDARP